MKSYFALLFLALPLIGAPAGASEAMRAAVDAKSITVAKAGDPTYMEIWFATKAPTAAAAAEDNATMGKWKHGSFIGLVQVGKQATDRRGDAIKPGLYVMRLSFHPVDGAHQGVAPQRDFIVLTNAQDDQDPAATPDFKTLMALALKGASHPNALSCWKVDDGFAPGLHTEGNDTVLHVKIGDVPVAIIVIGKAES